MTVRGSTRICLSLAALFLLAASEQAIARGGGRGGKYIGGIGSSHKGGHYFNPATGNHYRHRGTMTPPYVPHLGPLAVTPLPSGPMRMIDPAKAPIVSYSWRKEGGAMIANFRIRNTNAFAIKDVVVRCTHTTETASVYEVGSNMQTISQSIDPTGEVNLADINMGTLKPEVARATCSTTDYVPGP